MEVSSHFRPPPHPNIHTGEKYKNNNNFISLFLDGGVCIQTFYVCLLMYISWKDAVVIFWQISACGVWHMPATFWAICKVCLCQIWQRCGDKEEEAAATRACGQDATFCEDCLSLWWRRPLSRNASLQADLCSPAQAYRLSLPFLPLPLPAVLSHEHLSKHGHPPPLGEKENASKYFSVWMLCKHANK